MELLSFRRGRGASVCEHSDMPSVQASLAVAALAGVLAVASASGSVLLAGGVALVILVFTLGAVASADIHSARWAATVALATGGGALVLTYLDGTAGLMPTGALLGPALVVAIVVQLWRRDGRSQLTMSLTFAVTSCVLAALPVTWLALRESPDGPYPVGLALLGIGAVGLTEVLPVSRAGRRLVGVLVAAVGAGALVMSVEQVADAVPAVSAVVIATFAALMAAIAFAGVDRIAQELPVVPSPVSVQVVDQVSAAAEPGTVGELPDEATKAHGARAAAAFLPLRISLPFIAAAPAAYVLGRIFVA